MAHAVRAAMRCKESDETSSQLLTFCNQQRASSRQVGHCCTPGTCAATGARQPCYEHSGRAAIDGTPAVGWSATLQSRRVLSADEAKGKEERKRAMASTSQQLHRNVVWLPFVSTSQQMLSSIALTILAQMLLVLRAEETHRACMPLHIYVQCSCTTPVLHMLSLPSKIHSPSASIQRAQSMSTLSCACLKHSSWGVRPCARLSPTHLTIG